MNLITSKVKAFWSMKDAVDKDWRKMRVEVVGSFRTNWGYLEYSKKSCKSKEDRQPQ